MDSINGVNSILDALRRQLADNGALPRKSDSLPKSPERSGGTPKTVGEELCSTIRRRIAALDVHSPEDKVAAVRAFVESVLVTEFGEALLVESEFARMVDEVSAVLSGDPRFRKQLDNLLREV